MISTLNPTLTSAPTELTLHPSRYPSQIPSSTPTDYPTIEPTMEPTMNPTILKESLLEQVGGNLVFVIFIIFCLDLVLIVSALFYIVRYIVPRAKEPGNASLKEVLKRFEAIHWVLLILELSDLATDFWFGASLIVSSQDDENLFIVGWLSMMIAIIGAIIFFLKYLTYRKLIGHQVANLKTEWRQTDDATEKKRILEEIRRRVTDMDMISFLNSLLEDIPSIVLVV